MTRLVFSDRFGTRPTTEREGEAFEAALEALATQGSAFAPLAYSRVQLNSNEPGTSSSWSETVSAASGYSDQIAPRDSRLDELDSESQLARLFFRRRRDFETRPLLELAELYQSFFTAVASIQPRLAPQLDEDAVDWEFMDRSATAYRSGTVRARLRDMGPATPRHDDNPWD